MDLKNGYKVVYEIAADGKRTFYATKSNVYPPRDEAGNIIENEVNKQLASFDDKDFRGKTIYEYKGQFYVSKNALPTYKEDGTPADDKIEGFEALFVEGEPAAVVADVEPEETVTEPEASVVEDETTEGEDEEPEVNPEDEE